MEDNKNSASNNKNAIRRLTLPSVESPTINLDFPARISAQLFTYGKIRWKMNVRPFRLLMMVTQTLAMEKDPLPTLFPEYVFPLKKVFEYLGVSNNNKKYELLIDDMKEIMGTVVEIKETSKRGKIRWLGKTLISYCDINEETSTLHIQINEKSREYLVGMNRWSEMIPSIYLKLFTTNQNWFYAFFIKEMYLAENTTRPILIIATIDALKEQLFLTDTYSYNEGKNANEKFFSRVLGIEKPKGWKYDAKNETGNTPWNYVTHKGAPSGTLYTITKETDINVCAYPIKEGKSYTKICFIINKKKSFLTKNDKKRQEYRERQVDKDMSAPRRRKKADSSDPKQIMKDLFNEPPVLNSIENPSRDENLPAATHMIINMEIVEALYEQYKKNNDANHMTIDEFIENLGYTKNENGEIIKDMNKPLKI